MAMRDCRPVRTSAKTLCIRLCGLSGITLFLVTGEPANAHLQSFKCGFKSIAQEVGVDLGGGDGGMPKRLLDGENVGGAGIKRRGKGVPKRVWVHLLGDAGFGDPLGQAALHLPAGDSFQALAEERRRTVEGHFVAVFQVMVQSPPRLSVEESCDGLSALGSDGDALFGYVVAQGNLFLLKYY